MSGVSSTDGRQLDVFKIIEKKPNSNLIDLSTFDQCDDKTNVRVSVLEAFDPLLVKTEGYDEADTETEAVVAARDGENISFNFFKSNLSQYNSLQMRNRSSAAPSTIHLIPSTICIVQTRALIRIQFTRLLKNQQNHQPYHQQLLRRFHPEIHQRGTR